MIYYSIEFNSEIVYDPNAHINKSLFNIDIWAFAYKEDERALSYICKPVKGQIKDNRYFYEYKANGKGLKKNGVSIWARCFADTYEEAVIGFNMLVQRRVEFLKEEIIRIENRLITNKNLEEDKNNK